MEPDDGIEPLLLQAKQSQRSVLADYAGQSEYDNQGERVVAGQQLMQAVSDIFLGWQSATPPGRRSADPVRKISIIPRGQALGVTYQAPEADRYGYSETYLRGADHRHAGRPGPPRRSSTVTSPPAPKRYGTRQRNRPPDGGPAGQVPGHRAGLGAPLVRPGIVHGHGRRGPGHQGAHRHRNPADHRGMLPAGRGDPARQPGPAGPAGTHPPGPGNPGRRRGARRGRHLPRHRARHGRPRRGTVSHRTHPARSEKSSAERAGFHAPAGG